MHQNIIMPQKVSTVVQILFQSNKLEPSAATTNFFFERFTKLYLAGWQFSKLITMILRTNAKKLTLNDDFYEKTPGLSFTKLLTNVLRSLGFITRINWFFLLV